MIFLFLLDDCIYRFHICTERFGSRPENKKYCTTYFEKCHNYITRKVLNTEESEESKKSGINESLNL